MVVRNKQAEDREGAGVEAGGAGLSLAEAEEARRVAERVGAEVGELIRSFPLERRQISDIARWLGVTRPVCQRVVQATRTRGDPLEILTVLPGVQGLAAFVQAAADAGCEGGLVSSARAAAGVYADLIDRHGGSQSQLIAAVRAHLESAGAEGSSASGGDDSGVRARRSIFEGARALTGRDMEAQVGLFIYRPTKGDPGLVDCLTALTMTGIRLAEGGMPVCPASIFAQGDPESAPEELTVGPLGGEGPLPLGRLDEFCSQPPPRFTARRSGGRVSVLVDADRRDQPFDAALGLKLPGIAHPGLHEPRMQTCFVHTDGPARRLILGVYLHRSLAMRSIAMTGAYIRDRVGARVPGADGRIHVLTPQELWMVRLPDGPRLEYLGLGLADGVRGYGRLRELTAHLFGLEGWDPGEFVGYRIQVDYPVWNAQYLINFEFPEEGSREEG